MSDHDRTRDRAAAGARAARADNRAAMRTTDPVADGERAACDDHWLKRLAAELDARIADLDQLRLSGDAGHLTAGQRADLAATIRRLIAILRTRLDAAGRLSEGRGD